MQVEKVAAGFTVLNCFRIFLPQCHIGRSSLGSPVYNTGRREPRPSLFSPLFKAQYPPVRETQVSTGMPCIMKAGDAFRWQAPGDRSSSIPQDVRSFTPWWPGYSEHPPLPRFFDPPRDRGRPRAMMAAELFPGHRFCSAH